MGFLRRLNGLHLLDLLNLMDLFYLFRRNCLHSRQSLHGFDRYYNILAKIVDLTLGLRVSEEQEREGLDISSHGETAYNR